MSDGSRCSIRVLVHMGIDWICMARAAGDDGCLASTSDSRLWKQLLALTLVKVREIDASKYRLMVAVNTLMRKTPNRNWRRVEEAMELREGRGDDDVIAPYR